MTTVTSSDSRVLKVLSNDGASNVKPKKEVDMDALISEVSKVKIAQDGDNVVIPEVFEPDVVVSKYDTEVVDWEKESKGLDKMFEEQANSKLKNLPKFTKPKEFLPSVKLYKHQTEGIRWLISQETGAKPSPFVYEKTLKDGTVAEYCRLTKHRLDQQEPLHGCILADDMGLGKTIQSLGLILSNPAAEGDPACTLVVCPKSVISNWVQQISEHLQPGVLNVKIYDGSASQRSKMIPDLTGDDVQVCVVSYETLTAEYKRSKEINPRTNSPYPTLMDVYFHRMILDEAHNVRNATAKAFKAVMAVKTERKVCLTGTPFVNKPDDIYSLLAIINLQPLADRMVFETTITLPIRDRKRAGLTRLRTAMAYVALRRTKRVTNIKLVDKEVHIRHLDWDGSAHKATHDVLLSTAKSAFEATLPALESENEADKSAKTMINKALFEMLLRVRQACCHANLVPRDRVQRAEMASAELETYGERQMSSDEGRDMLNNLMGNDVKEMFGAPCEEVIGESPKIEALFAAIAEMKEGEKGIVFSQWTGFLDLIQKAAKERDIKVVRIDGSKSTEERISAMGKFANDDEVILILCSLKAAGTGINLTRGNVVFMMDVWWNEAAENQAMDRCHRVGQERDVRCIRFVMKDSIEERMVRLQQAKAALGKGSLEKISREEESLAKVATIKELFEIADQDVMETAVWKF